ncbi:MAG: O-antigen polymerase [Candidatus Acidiferrales bacterium]
MDSRLLLYILLALSLVLLTAVPAFQYLRRGRRDLFEPVYLGTFVFFMMFWGRSLRVLWVGSELIGEAPFSADIIESWNLAWIYLILATGAFFASYYSNIGKTIAKAFPPLRTEWNSGAARWMIVLFFGGGAAAFYSLVGRYGGLTLFLARRQDTGPTLGFGVGDVELLSYCVALSALAAYIVFLCRRRNIGSFFLLLLAALCVGLTAGSRTYFLYPVASLLLIDHYLRKPKKLRHLVYLGLIAALVVSPLVIVFREGMTLHEVSSSEAVVGRAGLPAFVERIAGMESLVLIVRDTPAVMDYQYGKTIAFIFIAWIPRYLWEDKPPSFTQLFTALYLGDVFAPGTVGYAPTIFGEAYINFHVAGIIAIAALGGILLRAFYEHLIARKRTASGVFIYSATLPFLIMCLESHFAAFLTPAWILLLTWTGARLISARQCEPATG